MFLPETSRHACNPWTQLGRSMHLHGAPQSQDLTQKPFLTFTPTFCSLRQGRYDDEVSTRQIVELLDYLAAAGHFLWKFKASLGIS
jgi:hypothetical protein